MIALVADHLLEAVAVGPHHLDLLGRRDQRLDARLRVAGIGVLHGHADNRSRLEIDDMLGFVGQVCPPVLHLRDCRVGIVLKVSVVVRPLLLPLPVDAGEIGACGGLDARGLRQLGQEVLIALPGVATHDAAQRGIRLQRRRVNPDRLPLHQAGVGQALQHPGEDGLVRLQIDRATRARTVE